jgi:hypothetical protein
MHKSHLYFSYLHQHDFRELLFSLQKSPTKSSSPTSRIKQMFFFKNNTFTKQIYQKVTLFLKFTKISSRRPLKTGQVIATLSTV